MSRAVTTRYRIETGCHLREPVRIAHVSDMHERNCDDILSMLKKARPDAVMVTGDTFERYDNRPQYDFYRRPIKKAIISTVHYTNYVLNQLMPKSKKANVANVHRFLSESAKIAPVYMSLGNHEQKLMKEDYRFLEENGIVLLENKDIDVELRGFRFTLGGMSVWDYESWLPVFLSKKGYKLLLCHEPNQYIELLADKGIDLTLSGHTHGGQLRIGKKGMGFFVPGQGLFGKYAHGNFFGGRLIVSAGCANTVAFPRPLNPRELVLIELR